MNMVPSRLLLSLATTTVFFYSSFAHCAEVHSGGWLGVFNRADSGQDRWHIWSEFQWRQRSKESRNRQGLFRFGPLFEINKQHEVGLLYALINTDGINEHRTTQQYVFNSAPWLLRMRLEQRFLSGQSQTNFRYRIMLRYDHKVTEQLQWVFWNESFWLLNNPQWVSSTVYERNRLFLGFRHHRHQLKWEWGYLNQSVRFSAKEIFEHLAVLYLFY
jgi:hypothetical protein